MNKTIFFSLFIFFLFNIFPQQVFSHCEIPCGIYGDLARIEAIYEHLHTIEKSMKEIHELSGKKDAMSHNQRVRWVQTKEEHANKIQHIVSQYFLTQRVKSVSPKKKAAYRDYQGQLTMLHQMLVLSMKCKQTVDKAYVKELRILVKNFYNSYYSSDRSELSPSL